MLGWVYFYKNAKFQNFWSPFHLLEFGPPYFRLQPKIQKSGSILLLGLLKGFQNCISQPCSTITHKEDLILENGLLPDQGPGGGPKRMVTSPNNTTFVCTNCENLEKIQIFSQKLFNL